MYVVKNQKELRMGYTTGSSATAATKAALEMLFCSKKVCNVQISTPKGIDLDLEVLDACILENAASCAIRKDGGDDPDVTNGIKIYSTVTLIDSGIKIDGGNGVGRVTRKGLKCKVGEAAINPTPRKMITEVTQEVFKKYDYRGGADIVISVENGAEIANQTFNPRLGIMGGISILGTSGIVEPMSEAALVETIRTEMEQRWQDGEKVLLVCPGNYGRDFARDHLGVDIDKGVKCSNYIGEMLDFAVYKGFEAVLLIGHAGKLIKLASGVMNTHSSYADGRQEIFAAHSAMLGLCPQEVKRIMDSITVDECIEILQESKIDQLVFDSIKIKVLDHLEKRTHKKINVEFIIFTNDYGILMKTEGAMALVDKYFKEKYND